MIKIALTNGTEHRYNLLDAAHEQRLHDAWYAMSDIPKCRHTKIRMITVGKETIDYEIGDIKDCVIINEQEQPITPIKDTTENHLFKLLKDKANQFEDILNSFSEKDKRKLFNFYSKILDFGLSIDAIAMQPVIIAMLKDPVDDIMKYVEIYKLSCQEHKKC